MPNINIQQTVFQNSPYIKEQRPKFTNIPNINEQKTNFQSISDRKEQITIYQNDPNISIQTTKIQNSPNINIQSSIFQNISQIGTNYVNYANQKNNIDNLTQSNNLYTTEYQIKTPYKNNPISNNLSLITPNNEVNYLPTRTSNIKANNFIKSKPQIETFGISNINNHYMPQNNYMPLFSSHNIKNNFKYNLNKGEALLNYTKTTPNMNKPLPYSYASYEPDISGEEHEPEALNQSKTYLPTSTTDIIPKNLFNTKKVIDLPKAFNPIKASFIIPHNQTNIPPITNTAINPSHSPIITSKRSFVISPPKKNIMTNPIISRVISSKPAIGNNLSIIGSNYSHIPMDNYSSRTIKRMPTTISRINYSPRIVKPVNQGIIYNPSNNIPINITTRAVSKSPIKYNVTSFMRNPRQLQTQRNVIYLPRRL